MPPSQQLELSYLASFPNGSLDPSVDKLGLGPMKIGHTDAAGLDPIALPESGTYLLGVTNPSSALAEAYSGLFVTPVSFGPGSVFSARARYIAPVGPKPDPGVTWVVGLMVRTGGAVASATEPRAGLTLQVREGGIRLNMPGSETPLNLGNMDQDRYDAVFNPDQPAPIELELLVNRVTGETKGTITIGDFSPVSANTKLKEFKPNAGPTITAVGPVIVVARPSGAKASVHARDFRLFTPKN